MAKLDRKSQLELLTILAEAYPRSATLRPSEGESQDDLTANLYYLWQHGLIDAKWLHTMDGVPHSGAVCINAKGMDFLAGDGGLSAILGVVTVRLHDDTIRDLLIKRIEAADGEPTAKKALVEKVRGLPAEALGKLTMDGLDAALAQAPRLVDLLSKLLG